MLYAFEEAIRIIEAYIPPDILVSIASRDAEPDMLHRSATRHALSSLFDRRQGTIRDAKIVPPTSQNQKMIENDLRHYVAPRVNLPADELRAHVNR